MLALTKPVNPDSVLMFQKFPSLVAVTLELSDDVQVWVIGLYSTVTIPPCEEDVFTRGTSVLSLRTSPTLVTIPWLLNVLVYEYI